VAGNQRRVQDDCPPVLCDPFREALSARLDGEALGLPRRTLDDHLAGCAGCTAWAEDAARVTRRARVAPAETTPDLTAAVLGQLAGPRPGAARAARERLVGTGLRLALLVVGAVQAGLAWTPLAHGLGAMSAPPHVAHETGAWGMALAVAFLAVAARPRLAAGALPLLVSFVSVLSVVTVSDLVAGLVDADRALGHLLLVVGLALVAVVAWRGRAGRRAAVLVSTAGPERVPA